MTTCPKCAAHLPEGAHNCPACGASLSPPGFWQRLFSRGTPPTISTTRTTQFSTQQIKVQDPKTGEVRVYGSLEEVPPEIRAQIEQAMQQADRTTPTTKITVTDSSGTTRTYNSVEEMPEDLRKLYERVQAQKSG